MRIRRRITLFTCLALGLHFALSYGGAASSLRLYGAPTPGSGGLEPGIWAVDSAFPGNTAFGLSLDNAIGGGPAFLLIGAQPLFAFGSGFHWNVLPLLVTAPIPLSGTPGLPGAGSVSLPLPIPNMPVLSGFDAWFQWVVSDPGAAYGYAATGGLRVTINDGPLVVAVGGSAIHAIEPLSGTQSNWSGSIGNLNDVVITPDGTRAVVTASSPDQFAVLDMTTGAILGGPTVTGTPNCAAITPDGRRAYGAVGSASTANDEKIIEIDIDPASPTFLQQIGIVTGYPVPLKQFEGIGISGDGKTLTAANLGLGGPAAVIAVDIEPSSPTYNTVIRFVQLYNGGYVTDVEPNHDGTLAFASMAFLANHGDMSVIDLTTGTVTATVTSVGLFPTDIDLDGRDEWAYISCPNSDSIARVNVNPFDPGYLSYTSAGGVASPYALSLSPEGDRVYVIQMVTGGKVVYEMDAKTLAITSQWTTPNPVAGGVAVR